jgi:hypothetical protein
MDPLGELQFHIFLNVDTRTIIDLLGIIHHPGCFIKNDVSATGFCLHPHVKTYSIVPNRQS